MFGSMSERARATEFVFAMKPWLAGSIGVVLSGSRADPANVNVTMNNRTIAKPLVK